MKGPLSRKLHPEVAPGGGLGDPLTGMDEDGDFLSFMAAQSADGAVTVISWEYPAAAEGFGARLTQIANTFELTE